MLLVHHQPQPAHHLSNRRRDRHGGRCTQPFDARTLLREGGSRGNRPFPPCSCPRRDSNPRYSLERAVTWAASRRGQAEAG